MCLAVMYLWITHSHILSPMQSATKDHYKSLGQITFPNIVNMRTPGFPHSHVFFLLRSVEPTIFFVYEKPPWQSQLSITWYIWNHSKLQRTTLAEWVEPYPATIDKYHVTPQKRKEGCPILPLFCIQFSSAIHATITTICILFTGRQYI